MKEQEIEVKYLTERETKLIEERKNSLIKAGNFDSQADKLKLERSNKISPFFFEMSEIGKIEDDKERLEEYDKIRMKIEAEWIMYDILIQQAINEKFRYEQKNIKAQEELDKLRKRLKEEKEKMTIFVDKLNKQLKGGD